MSESFNESLDELRQLNRLRGRLEAQDPVNHPPHYTSHPSGIEAIEVTRHMNFNLGNATKYIWRAGLKADRLEDLKKARFYINDEINRLEGTN